MRGYRVAKLTMSPFISTSLNGCCVIAIKPPPELLAREYDIGKAVVDESMLLWVLS